MLAACDVLRSIVIPDGETFESLFELTIKILNKELTQSEINELKKNETYYNAIQTILKACKVFHNQITNIGLTNAVHEVTIDILFEGQKSKHTGATLIHGLDGKDIEFPLILGKNMDEQKKFWKSLKK